MRIFSLENKQKSYNSEVMVSEPKPGDYAKYKENSQLNRHFWDIVFKNPQEGCEVLGKEEGS